MNKMRIFSLTINSTFCFCHGKRSPPITQTPNDPRFKDIVENYTSIGCLDKCQAITRSAYLSATDPTNGQHYSTLTDLTSYQAAQRIYRKMIQDETGQRILKQKPRITDETYYKLQSLPEASFGKQYFKFMNGLQFRPSERPTVNYIADLELAYVLQRYKEIHDFIHVLIGQSIGIDEELVIKWFEMRQLGLPSTVLASLMSPILSSSFNIAEVSKAIKLADKVIPIMNVYYQQQFESPIVHYHRFRTKQEVNWVTTDLLMRSTMFDNIIFLNRIYIILSMKPTYLRIRERIEYHGAPEDLENLCLDDIPIPNFTPLIINEIFQCTHVGYLSLNECSISSLENFPSIPGLLCVQLQGNQIKSEQLKYLTSCKDLTNICLDNNEINSLEQFSCFKQLENLQHIEIKGNPVCQINNFREILFEMLPHIQLINCQDRDGNQDIIYEIDQDSESNEESSEYDQQISQISDISSIDDSEENQTEAKRDEHDSLRKYRKM